MRTPNITYVRVWVWGGGAFLSESSVVAKLAEAADGQMIEKELKEKEHKFNLRTPRARS